MSQTHQGAGLGRIAVGLALDYLRWTQLIPMIFAWTFLLIMVGALLLTSFQQQSFGLVERGIVLYERFAGPMEPQAEAADPVDRASSETGTGQPGPGRDDPGNVDPADVDPGTEDPDEANREGTDPGGESAGPPEVDDAETQATPSSGGVHFTDEDIMPVVLRAWAILALAGWLLGMLRTMLFGPRAPVAFRRKLAWAGAAAALCSALMFFAWQFGTETFQGGPTGWILLFTGVPLGVWIVSAWSLLVGHVCERIKRALYGDAI